MLKITMIHTPKFIKFEFFDECSQLDIKYSNTRFNDNFNTKPKKLLGFNFYMDYLRIFWI